MSNTVEDAIKPSIRGYVKVALDSTGDDPSAAIRWLCKKANKEPYLREALITYGAKQIVRDHYSAQRSSAMSMAVGRVMDTADSQASKERMTARLARVAFWDAYTLFGMAPIGDATREDLLSSAEQRETQARGELRLARFERAVAVKLEGHKTVRQSMTLAQLEKMAKRYYEVV
tara:strand:- start:572 stop:1093 length:522 start_codon:yes stop_codon:yes gene_type:complete